MSPKLRDVLEIFGKDKATWQKYFFEEIESSQLTTHFGGTRPESLDFSDLYASNKTFRCDLSFGSTLHPFYKLCTRSF